MRCFVLIIPLILSTLIPLGASAEWRFRAETQEAQERGADPLVSQHAWTRSTDGYGVLEVVCTAGGSLFITLDYLSFETRAGEVTVQVRVDESNPLINRWQVVESPMNTLTALSTNPVLVPEIVRRLTVGRQALVIVESLPRLFFDLAGSGPVLLPILEICDETTTLR